MAFPFIAGEATNTSRPRPAFFTTARLERVVNVLGIVFGLGWMMTIFLPHIYMITAPGPQELNEPAMWYGTYLLDHGRNPYALEELPGAAQFFGPLYNYIVLAFKPVLGTSYAAHRTVNFFCIAGSFWLIGTRMRRAGTSLGVTLMSIGFLYALCIENIMISGRPDGPGFLLFLLGLLIPMERDYRPRATVIGLACAFLAFHCKAYFMLAGIGTIVGVALNRSKREALIYFAGFMIALAASVALLSAIFPFYFVQTITMTGATLTGNSSDEFGAVHTVRLLKTTWPFLIVMIFGAAHWAANFPVRQTWQELRSTALNLSAPIGGRRIPVFGLVFLIFLAAIQLKMGNNGGASFTYHIHLLLPLMFILSAGIVTTPAAKLWLSLGLGALAFQFYDSPRIVDTAPGYRRLREVISQHQNVLGMPCAVEILAEQGERIYDDGFTIFLPFLFGNDRPKHDPDAAKIITRYDAMTTEMVANVIARQYDLILTANDMAYFFEMATVQANYELKETFQFPTYFGHAPIQVWEPRKTPAATGPAAPPQNRSGF